MTFFVKYCRGCLHDQLSIKILHRDYIHAGAEMVSYVLTISSKIVFLIIGLKHIFFHLYKINYTIPLLRVCKKSASHIDIMKSHFCECYMGHY